MCKCCIFCKCCCRFEKPDFSTFDNKLEELKELARLKDEYYKSGRDLNKQVEELKGKFFAPGEVIRICDLTSFWGEKEELYKEQPYEKIRILTNQITEDGNTKTKEYYYYPGEGITDSGRKL